MPVTRKRHFFSALVLLGLIAGVIDRAHASVIVTREFEKSASREQKLALLECLFAVSAIDESTRTVEDNEIRRVASELKLDHNDYIAVRAAHVAHLASRK